jgi:ubiquinone/menaquinone biosynthesis C-methylase UbiE
MKVEYDHNLKVYSSKNICESYIAMEELQLPERTILQIIGDNIRGKRIFDIGIGAGRTTYHLLQYSDLYTGVDYSERMVQIAKNKYLNVNILQMDARDLGSFADSSFDLVFFLLTELIT